MSNNRTIAGEINRILGARDQRRSIASKTRTEKVSAIILGDPKYTDINNITVNQTKVPTSDVGAISAIVSFMGYMIKAITGKANWKTLPAINLENIAAWDANSDGIVDEAVNANDSDMLGGMDPTYYALAEDLEGLGGTPIIWKGTWSDATTYAANEGADYNGSSYVSLQNANLNQQPPNATWWQLVANKGDQGDPGIQGDQGIQGDPGINVVWTGAWNSVTSYVVNDGVESGGSSYICKSEHSNQQPPNLTYWDLFISKGDQGDQGVQGDQGDQGVQGDQGIQGVPGEGVVAEGTAGQVLAKIDDTDYNTHWITVSIEESVWGGM